MVNKYLESYLYLLARIYFRLNKPFVILVLSEIEKPLSIVKNLLKPKFKISRLTARGENAFSDSIASILGVARPARAIKMNDLIIATLNAFKNDQSQILLINLCHEHLDRPKEIGKLFRPRLLIITGIKKAIRKIGNQLIEERAKLMHVLSQGAYVILNVDDPAVKKLSFGGHWRRITYAQNGIADIMAKNSGKHCSDMEEVMIADGVARALCFKET